MTPNPSRSNASRPDASRPDASRSDASRPDGEEPARAVAVVGPGRLGTSIARRWIDAGCTFVGFVGRTPGRVESSLAFCGEGATLSVDALCEHALRAPLSVLLAVGDTELPAVAAEYADQLERRGAAAPTAASNLWFHASGALGLSVLEPLARAGRPVGVMHPLCPIPDAESGVRTLDGAPATLVTSDAAAHAVLDELARAAGLRPIELKADADRSLYHAACALAANGATALYDVAMALMTHCVRDSDDSQTAITALMADAVALCDRRGTLAALSGPVRRGDHEVVAAHVAALARTQPAASELYRQLMAHALTLTIEAGAAPSNAQVEALRAVLAPKPETRG